MNILQKIFSDHYEDIFQLQPRKSIIENVKKMINCGDPRYGGAMYGCTDCGTLKFVPFRCHSRFCPSCGNKYSMERTTSISFKLLRCTHRHLVFTIDENLRSYFAKDRSLLNALFHAVTSVISRMFFELNKSKNYVPGYVMVLHTFGRDLKWNPHIHCLISEGGLNNRDEWRKITHFNYTYLRKSFQTALLNEMQSVLGDSFKKFKSECYKNHKNGFYVYAKPNLCDPLTITKYIGRYLGRPVIATSRIDKYDGEFVTFHYNRHEDDKYVEEKLPAMDFIKRLIRHIPEKNFKMIRYGGIYAKKRPNINKMNYAVHPDFHTFFRSFNKWRNAISSAFGYDPIKCPICGNTMEVLELRFKKERVPLEEMYKKAMSRFCRKRSSA